MTATAADIAEALGWLSPDCEREQWWRVLAAIKAALGNAGRDIADEWSRGSDRYRAADFRTTWDSTGEIGIGPGTLFFLAREAGYRPEGPPPARPPLRPAERPQRAQPESRTQHLARELWARADRADAAVAAHPYAVRKKIGHAAGAGRAAASGRVVGQHADCIVVPLRTLDAELVGVEIINAEGAKQTFGRKGVLVLGNDLDPMLPTLVVEGWATAVHTLNAYDWNACAVFAGGKGRLHQVAAELERRHPDREIIVCKEADQ